MIFKSIQIVFIICVSILSGCGGSETPTSSLPTTSDTTSEITTSEEETETLQPNALLEGVFIDSIVQGVEYISDNSSDIINGITDAQGKFIYRSGSTISFYIGDILLGQTLAAPVLTPVSLVDGAEDEQNEIVTNIGMFLLTLDTDGNPDNGITISEEIRDECIQKAIDFEQTISNFENDNNLLTLLSTLNSSNVFTDENERNLYSAETVQNHIKETLDGLTQQSSSDNSTDNETNLDENGCEEDFSMIGTWKGISTVSLAEDVSKTCTYEQTLVFESNPDGNPSGTVDVVIVESTTDSCEAGSGTVAIKEMDDDLVKIKYTYTHDYENGTIVRYTSYPIFTIISCDTIKYIGAEDMFGQGIVIINTVLVKQ